MKFKEKFLKFLEKNKDKNRRLVLCLEFCLSDEREPKVIVSDVRQEHKLREYNNAEIFIAHSTITFKTYRDTSLKDIKNCQKSANNFNLFFECIKPLQEKYHYKYLYHMTSGFLFTKIILEFSFPKTIESNLSPSGDRYCSFSTRN